MTREKVDELICRALRECTTGHEILTSLAWGMIQGTRLNERAAERERCAKIAEDAAYVYEGRRIDGYSKGQYMMINGEKTVASIAARIREGQDL